MNVEGRNALLQDLALGRLGVSKVHHLVEQLVAEEGSRVSMNFRFQAGRPDAHNDEVIPNRLLLQLLEILGQDLRKQESQFAKREELGGLTHRDELVQERQDLGRIRVLLRQRHDCKAQTTR